MNKFNEQHMEKIVMKKTLTFKHVVKLSCEWINAHPDQNYLLRETTEEEKAGCGGTHVLIRRLPSNVVICIYSAPSVLTDLDDDDESGLLLEREWECIRLLSVGKEADFEKLPGLFFKDELQ